MELPQSSGMRTAVSPLFFMTRDTYAKAAQHQNELNAFADYERRFWLAYTRSQNPYPPKWQRPYRGRKLHRHCSLDALD